MVNALAPVRSSLEPATRLWQSVAIALSSLGAVQAISGATTAELISNPSSPVAGETGIAFTVAFTVNNTEKPAQSWKLRSDLPPGLVMRDALGNHMSPAGVINARTAIISGTPTQAGTFGVLVQPYSGLNGTGDSTVFPLQLQIDITGEAVAAAVPALKIDLVNRQLVASWAQDDASPFQLESSSDARTWAVANRPVVANGGLRSVIFDQVEVVQPLYLRLAPSP